MISRADRNEDNKTGKMHLGVVRLTTGLPLCSLSLHRSHKSHLLSSVPPPATTARWNPNPEITPLSPLLPLDPPLTLWTVRVWEDEVRGSEIPRSHQSCLSFCHSTPPDNASRERQGGFILIMSLITGDELWGRSATSFAPSVWGTDETEAAGLYKNNTKTHAQKGGSLVISPFSQREI